MKPQTLARITAAIELIKEAEHPTEVRFANAYAHGYLDALYDEGILPAAEAQKYRDAAQVVRNKRLSDLGADPLHQPA